MTDPAISQGATPRPETVQPDPPARPIGKPGPPAPRATGDPMKFGDALLWLCRATTHRVRRQGWGEDPSVLFLQDDQLTLRKADGTVCPCLIHRGDIENDDWVAVP